LTPPEDWIVITADAGKTGPKIHAKGPPLHLILPNKRIRAFFLSGKRLTQISGQERAIAIISRMPDMLAAARQSPEHMRYKVIRRHNAIVVEPWPLTPSPDARTPRPNQP